MAALAAVWQKPGCWDLAITAVETTRSCSVREASLYVAERLQFYERVLACIHAIQTLRVVHDGWTVDDAVGWLRENQRWLSDLPEALTTAERVTSRSLAASRPIALTCEALRSRHWCCSSCASCFQMVTNVQELD
jgi:hypothetical protein